MSGISISCKKPGNTPDTWNSGVKYIFYRVFLSSRWPIWRCALHTPAFPTVSWALGSRPGHFAVELPSTHSRSCWPTVMASQRKTGTMRLFHLRKLSLRLLKLLPVRAEWEQSGDEDPPPHTLPNHFHQHTHCQIPKPCCVNMTGTEDGVRTVK